MSSYPLLLLYLIDMASSQVDDRELILVLTQNLAARVNFVLFPMGCHHSVYSSAPATVINWEALESGRHPHRVIAVNCATNVELSNVWLFRNQAMRDLGLEYFTLIDLTKSSVPEGPETIPFSFVIYKPGGDYFEIYVNSDFNGAWKPLNPITVSREAVASDELDLSRILIYDASIHDSEMQVDIISNSFVQIYSKHPTNYSEPGRPVYEGNGLAMNIALTHPVSVIPVAIDHQVAMYLNPRILTNDFLLLLPFSSEIWTLLLVFSALIALIMTITLRQLSKRNHMLIFVESLIYAFFSTFTTLQVPHRSRFKSATPMIAVVSWIVLCIIPQTGYKSSLASILQNPPREERYSTAQYEIWYTDRIVQSEVPDFDAFMNELRSDVAWYGSETTLRFLGSVWGLTKATYIVDANAEGPQATSLVCDSYVGKSYACRSSQREMRHLYEMDVLEFLVNREHMLKTCS